MSGADTATHDEVANVDEVFCDTCVLINYIQREWEDDRTSELLEASHIAIIIGENVEEEVDTVIDRRSNIYPDMLDFVAEQEGDIAEYTPSDEINVQKNDRGHLQDVKETILRHEEDNPLRKLRRYAKKVDRRINYVLSELVDDVVLTSTSFLVTVAINDVIDNEADCQVVSDAAGWTENGGSGVVSTLDSSDILQLDDEINDVLASEMDADVELLFIAPDDLIERVETEDAEGEDEDQHKV